MAKFECDWCGKCCTSFGEFITIERQLSGSDYYCRYGITNEIFPVHVQREFAGEIDEEFTEYGSAGGSGRRGCIFLRKNPEGTGFACAVYVTRPPVCREFRCYRLLIYQASSGELRGKVVGRGDLKTCDGNLKTIWDEEIANLPHPSSPVRARAGGAPHVYDTVQDPGDGEWVTTVLAILAAHGYRGEPVS